MEREEEMINALSLKSQMEGIVYAEYEKLPFIKSLVGEYKQCSRLGMKKRMKTLKEEIGVRLVAASLEAMGFSLLRTYYLSSGYHTLQIVSKEGNRDELRSVFRKKSLAKFDRPIPLEILEQLPNNAIKKGIVFYEEVGRDPFLCVKIKRNYYVALYQWD